MALGPCQHPVVRLSTNAPGTIMHPCCGGQQGRVAMGPTANIPDPKPSMEMPPATKKRAQGVACAHLRSAKWEEALSWGQ